MLGADSSRAFYGPGHVLAAAELGAIQTLLISGAMLELASGCSEFHRGLVHAAAQFGISNLKAALVRVYKVVSNGCLQPHSWAVAAARPGKLENSNILMRLLLASQGLPCTFCCPAHPLHEHYSAM
jgi:hypothetical protein